MKIITILYTVLTLISCSSTQNEEQIVFNKAHYTEDGFKNFPEVAEMPSKGIMFFLRRIKHSIFLDEAPATHSISQEEAIKKYHSLENSNTITWLGHSAFLIKIDGKVILTDPYISNYATPIPPFGPRRIIPLGIKIDELPKIDIIILSHNHYDHLNGIEDLKNKETIQVMTLLKNGYLFTDAGFKNIKELDWGERFDFKGLKFFAHPTVHNSRRGLFDANKSLWGSWVIESKDKKIFFAGDTAYSNSIFKDIGRLHKTIDYAFVPIGAYEPREVMKMIHTNPSEAVQIGIDIKAKKLIAMHWGTINLSDEPMFEPPILFEKTAKEKNKEVIVMKIGDSILIE